MRFKVMNDSRFAILATLPLLVFAVALAGASQSNAAVVFSQDFETGLGPDEIVSGGFQINNTSILNNGSLMMGHPARYGNNEYSYYEVMLDLTNFDQVELQFDFQADFETHFDRFNMQAAVCPVNPPNDLVSPVSGMSYRSDHIHKSELGTIYFDTSSEMSGTAVFDLSAFDRQADVCIRFQFGSDGSVTDLGINFDEVLVTGEPVNQAPDCSDAVASPSDVWPPDNRLRPIEIVGVVDPDGDPVTITPEAVFHNEAGNGPGMGGPSPDATLSPLAVRATRDGGGGGRTYGIDFTADDGLGGVCAGTVTVCVPLDQSGQGCEDLVSQERMVEICHIPPGNPGNAHIIRVSENADPAHVGHGDKVVPDDGTCSVGVGECVASGTLSCTADGLVCDAVPGAPPEGVEISCDDGLDNDCDGLVDEADSDCPMLPLVCDTGDVGVSSGDPWVVCEANENEAWLSANVSGIYDPELICNHLGYDALGQWGGNCGSVCGFCEGSTSCENTGRRRFDGAGNCGLPNCLRFTVTWTCVNNDAAAAARAAAFGQNCGLGFELAFLLPPLMWLRSRVRRRVG